MKKDRRGRLRGQGGAKGRSRTRHTWHGGQAIVKAAQAFLGLPLLCLPMRGGEGGGRGGGERGGEERGMVGRVTT